jgi:SPP1 family predicted phage head-tail adaptor
MQAGQLRHQITIQQQSTSLVGGERVTTWTTVVQTWAAISPLSGREYLNAATVNANVSHRIVMRYQSGIGSAMRVQYGTRVFDIQSVLNIDERNREMHLLCLERLNA